MAKSAFELKNESFQLLRVKVSESDWSGLQEFVADQVTRAPELLSGCFLALDLSQVPAPSDEELEDIQLRLRYAGVNHLAFVAVPETALDTRLRERGLPVILPPINQRAIEPQPARAMASNSDVTAPKEPDDAQELELKQTRKKRTQGNDFKDVLGSVFGQKSDSGAAQAGSLERTADAKREPVAPSLQPAAAAAAPQVSVSQSEVGAIQSAQRYDGQVRSGQQVYARGRDLLVIGNVGAGAEIVADGSVHIYGRLMGKVIAGAQGDRNARIYCLAFGAELVSIAGNFRVIDSMSSDIRGRPVQIYLDGDRIKIEAIG